MKTVLFCYDGPLKKDEENAYYSTSLTNEVFNRYKTIAENIRIIMNVKKIKKNKDVGRYTKIDIEEYKIVDCPKLLSLKGLIFNYKKCKKVLEEEIPKADYVIIRLPGMVGILAAKIAQKYRKIYLIEMVGCPWDSLSNHSLKGKIIAPAMTIITKKIVKNAPYVLYVSNNFLQKRYPTKGKAIACSDVNLKKLDKEILENKVRNAKKINKDSKIVLATVAAVNVKYKGQQYVFKVIKDMKKQGYNIEYKLIGGGDNKYLKSLVEKYNIEKEVIFLGAVKHNEIFEILKTVDIYIQPSLQEGLCRALIEAMSVGCCCIASNAGGNTELLDSEFIFKKKRVKELEKIIKRVINDNALIQKACERNYEYSKKYDKKNTERLRNEFYLEVKRGKK